MVETLCQSHRDKTALSTWWEQWHWRNKCWKFAWCSFHITQLGLIFLPNLEWPSEVLNLWWRANHRMNENFGTLKECQTILCQETVAFIFLVESQIIEALTFFPLWETYIIWSSELNHRIWKYLSTEKNYKFVDSNMLGFKFGLSIDDWNKWARRVLYMKQVN